MLCTQQHWVATRNSKTIPRPAPHGPPWPPEDIGTAVTQLLVAWDAHICEELCWRICHLLTSKDKLAPNKPASNTYQGLYNRTTLCPDLLWLHHRLAGLQQFWLSHNCGRPWAFEGGNFMPLSQSHQHYRNCGTPHSEPLPKIWPAK